MIDEPHLINLQVPLLVTETQEILDKNIRANATENIADFREDKMMWWPFCFILTLFFASFTVKAEFNVDKSSEVSFLIGAEKEIQFSERCGKTLG